MKQAQGLDAANPAASLAATPAASPVTSAARDPAPLTLADEALIDAEAVNAPPPAPTPAPSRWRQIVLGASLVLIAFNLRPLFSSFGAVLPEFLHSTGLSAASASLITTLPVLCLGVFAPLAPMLSRRFGTERTILALMALLSAGVALRGLGAVGAYGIGMVLLGTALAGASIAVINVLLPGLVKRDFSHRTGLMTGLYTMALCAGAAAAAGLTLPLERWLGNSWPAALAVWAAPAALVALLWLPQVPRQRASSHLAGERVRGLWRCPLAWQVTLFMVLQSMLSFSVFGWLAPALRERGVEGASAGMIVSVSVLVQTVACLIAPPLAARSRDQRLINAIVVILAVGGFLGCLFAPLTQVWFWAVVQGLGQGSLTSVALTLIVLRSQDARVAAQLSSMVQGVGYGFGAAGPLLVGLLHGWTHGFGAVGIFFALVGVCAVLTGLGAGRNLHVRTLRTEAAASGFTRPSS